MSSMEGGGLEGWGRGGLAGGVGGEGGGERRVGGKGRRGTYWRKRVGGGCTGGMGYSSSRDSWHRFCFAIV